MIVRSLSIFCSCTQKKLLKNTRFMWPYNFCKKLSYMQTVSCIKCEFMCKTIHFLLKNEASFAFLRTNFCRKRIAIYVAAALLNARKFLPEWFVCIVLFSKLAYGLGLSKTLFHQTYCIISISYFILFYVVVKKAGSWVWC